MNQLLYSVPDAAKMLDLAEVTVWKLIYSRKLGSVQIGRSRKIKGTEIERFVDDRTIPAKAS